MNKVQQNTINLSLNINNLTYKQLVQRRNIMYDMRLDKDENVREKYYMELGLIENKLAYFDSLPEVCKQF